MQCPKCGFESSSNVECEGCGIVFSKIKARPMERPQTQQAESTSLQAIELFFGENQKLYVEQHARHWWEILLNWEQANKYVVSNERGRTIGLISESSQGFLNALTRVFLGSHRPLDVDVVSYGVNDIIMAFERNFFFFFSDLTVVTPDGIRLGQIRRRFGIIHRRYDLLDERGDLFATVSSPLWRLWTFPIFDRHGNQVAVISKKWSGLAKEYFTDADNFQLDFGTHHWTLKQRAVIFAAALSIDFDFFENNQGSR